MSWTTKDFSPEVAQRLGVVARELRQMVWGGDGVPEWGTLFSEIEHNGMSIGGELARLMMEQAVDEQAQGKPSEQSLAREGEIATVTKTDQAALETPAGAVRWDQPKARLKAQRREFFPSVEVIGN